MTFVSRAKVLFARTVLPFGDFTIEPGDHYAIGVQTVTWTWVMEVNCRTNWHRHRRIAYEGTPRPERMVLTAYRHNDVVPIDPLAAYVSPESLGQRVGNLMSMVNRPSWHELVIVEDREWLA